MAAAQTPTLASRIDVRQLITEKSAFAPEKYNGFALLMNAIAKKASANLSFGPELTPELSFSDAQDLRPEAIMAIDASATLGFQLDFEAVDAPGAVIVSRSLFFRWYECAFGGAENIDSVFPERPLTELEIDAATLFTTAICDSLLENLGKIGTRARARIAPFAEGEDAGSVARKSLQFCAFFDGALGDITGEVVIVLPLILLDPLRETPREAAAEKPKLPDPAWESTLQSTVRHTHLKLKAVLGGRPMTLGEITALEVGQVIPLGNNVHRPITIEANGNPLFRVFLGQSEGRYVLKYDGMMEKG